MQCFVWGGVCRCATVNRKTSSRAPSVALPLSCAVPGRPVQSSTLLSRPAAPPLSRDTHGRTVERGGLPSHTPRSSPRTEGHLREFRLKEYARIA